jgi:hypothetical protein
MAKLILAVLLTLLCSSSGFADLFDEGYTWVSNLYGRPGPWYRLDDRVLKVKKVGLFGEDYIFRKSGRNHYKAYDHETGNLLELKVKRDGALEIYDYETGDSWSVKDAAKRE